MAWCQLSMAWCQQRADASRVLGRVPDCGELLALARSRWPLSPYATDSGTHRSKTSSSLTTRQCIFLIVAPVSRLTIEMSIISLFHWKQNPLIHNVVVNVNWLFLAQIDYGFSWWALNLLCSDGAPYITTWSASLTDLGMGKAQFPQINPWPPSPR